jgi:hypothetical protein
MTLFTPCHPERIVSGTCGVKRKAHGGITLPPTFAKNK